MPETRHRAPVGVLQVRAAVIVRPLVRYRIRLDHTDEVLLLSAVAIAAVKVQGQMSDRVKVNVSQVESEASKSNAPKDLQNAKPNHHVIFTAI